MTVMHITRCMFKELNKIHVLLWVWRDGPQDPYSRIRCTSNTQLTISLNFFIGSTLTVFDAGFALNTHGSLVKGFTPLRAAVAGFFFSFTFNIPPSLKEPCFFQLVSGHGEETFNCSLSIFRFQAQSFSDGTVCCRG